MPYKKKSNIEIIHDWVRGIDGWTGASRETDSQRKRRTEKYRDVTDTVEFRRDLNDGLEGSRRMLKRSEEKMKRKKKYGPSTQRRTKDAD